MAYYSLQELTDLIGMHKRTILDWVQDGNIPHKFRRGRGGKQYQIEDLDILKHLASLPQVQGFFGILNDMIKREPFLGDETIRDLLRVYFCE